MSTSEEQKILVILSNANNWTANVNLYSPLNYNYCKIIANSQFLISTNFLKTGYTYNATPNLTDFTFDPVTGLALAGGKMTYKVNERNFTKLQITLAEPIKNSLDELQLVFYFFNNF